MEKMVYLHFVLVCMCILYFSRVNSEMSIYDKLACSLDSGLTFTEMDQQCKAPGSHESCSGRGKCVCGKCKCYSRTLSSAQTYTGKFCQCDDYSCPLYANALCGGPNRGNCLCGECLCNAGYQGSNCGCSVRNDSCIASDGRLCGGKGRCECNKCICEDGMYGPTCEDCKGCHYHICREHKDCVKCIAYGTGPLTQEECKTTCKTNINVVYILPEDSSNFFSCRYKDEDDCIFRFGYSYHPTFDILVQSTKECGDLNLKATTPGNSATRPYRITPRIWALLWILFVTITKMSWC